MIVSAASVWETAIKGSLNKLFVKAESVDFLKRLVETYNFITLPIYVTQPGTTYDLPNTHSDQFDRPLDAQAKNEDLALLTNDSEIEKYCAKVVC